MRERTTDQQLADLKERFGVPAEWVDWDMIFNDPDTALRNDGFIDGSHGATLACPAMTARNADGDEVLMTVVVNSVEGVMIELYDDEHDIFPFGWAPSFFDAMLLMAKGEALR